MINGQLPLLWRGLGWGFWATLYFNAFALGLSGWNFLKNAV